MGAYRRMNTNCEHCNNADRTPARAEAKMPLRCRLTHVGSRASDRHDRGRGARLVYVLALLGLCLALSARGSQEKLAQQGSRGPAAGARDACTSPSFDAARLALVKKFSQGFCHRAGGLKSKYEKDNPDLHKRPEGVWQRQSGASTVPWSLLEAAPHLVADGDMYQFGVFEGRTLEWMQTAFPAKYTWGFDSFIGLPEEAADVPQLRHWDVGQYHAGKGGHSVESMTRRFGGPDKVQFVKGFYNESLSAASLGPLRHKMRPAFYVDIDCDLYVSTVQVLEWMFREGLITVGTIIGYDDWWVMPCASLRLQGPDGTYVSPRPEDLLIEARDERMDIWAHGGEAQAHREMAEKYKVRFRCVCGPCTSGTVHMWYDWRPYFVVEAMGEGVAPDTGFAMHQDDVVKWMASNAMCQHHYRRSFDYVA